jgi:hypothetical protein
MSKVSVAVFLICGIAVICGAPYPGFNNATTNRLRSNIAAVQDASDVVQKIKKKAPKPVFQTYTDEENVVRRSSITWGEFSTMAATAPRTKPYIRSSALKALQQCTAPNAAPTCKEVELSVCIYIVLFLTCGLAKLGAQ